MEKFIKGLELSRLFYLEAVQPIINKKFPQLTYSAALLGQGSDVLGFDTSQSMDHDWGPRLLLFLSETDFSLYKAEIDKVLKHELPMTFLGYPTNFGLHADGTTVMAEAENTLVNHRIKIHTVKTYFKSILNFDPTNEIQPADWVGIPQNNLLMLTAGSVFHDGLGKIVPLRKKLEYYPFDVWLYILAAQWQRISQEEHFMGRCGQVADDLGSRIIAAQLVRDIMCLCFMMERKYYPYSKWFGSAFAQLKCSGQVLPVLLKVMSAGSWQERQDHLCAAYEFIAAMHNSLRITEQLPAKVSQFHKRPFMVIQAEEFACVIRDQIKDEQVLALPKNLGAFDQFINSTDALNYLEKIKSVF
ncbi:DUF4037 domain-containing protein [Pelolinea submarina]|uniref:Uncharacterized protein DUF4037 n=1 Tax=Pelolinea submarina TaxID=913107 RepID=A0A347ZQJ9_9CHLR|nr:DUF4037 domain-containing protein [Pelolinea submarina]REG06086.1 uncharacterized protein DUF4037 [Pelolinea submarina]BBB47580.1 hypothetical protein Pelsub_P0807 [Pelolinea submarina]